MLLELISRPLTTSCFFNLNEFLPRQIEVFKEKECGDLGKDLGEDIEAH